MEKSLTSATAPILDVKGLVKHFELHAGILATAVTRVRAVDGVDFSVRRGATLGLVGESGSGKSTAGQTILRLIPATAGSVTFDGMDVLKLTGPALKDYRRRMQVVFQDPVSSLDPRMTVGAIVAEPLLIHGNLTGKRRKERSAELLAMVGLGAEAMSRYPHEFSGGQRQRIGIARALASGPEFIVCDEPVSALDVSIQAQILNLLKDLQTRLGLSYLFIAHNLAVVEQFVDDVAVMYCGRIVERGSRDAVYSRPAHPYTQALFAAAPKIDAEPTGRSRTLQGETPSPISPPRGCAFHPRCQYTRDVAAGLAERDTVEVECAGQTVRVMRRCTEQRLELKAVDREAGHRHACVLRQ